MSLFSRKKNPPYKIKLSNKRKTHINAHTYDFEAVNTRTGWKKTGRYEKRFK